MAAVRGIAGSGSVLVSSCVYVGCSLGEVSWVRRAGQNESRIEPIFLPLRVLFAMSEWLPIR